MMCRIAVLTFAVLASANAANFLGEHPKVSGSTEEESATDEHVVVKASDMGDIETELLETDGAELVDDVGEAQEDMLFDDDQEPAHEDEAMDISDDTAQDDDEGSASLVQKPKSTELPDDDETTALATDDAVEDGTVEDDTDEASEETDDDDSAASSEETSDGDPSADESADSLQDPSSAEGPVAETYSYDDSGSGSVNMVNLDGLTDSDQASVEDAQVEEDQDTDEVATHEESASVDDEATTADAYDKSDVMEAKPLGDQPEEKSTHDVHAGETASLKDGVTELHGAVDHARAQQPNNFTAKLSKNDNLVQTIDVGSLRNSVLANKEFKLKVQSVCKNSPNRPSCAEATTEVLICQLLKKAQPKAAENVCAHVNMDSTHSAAQNIANKISLSWMATKVQPKFFEKELEQEMTHNSEINLNTIILEAFAASTFGATATHTK